MSGILGLRYFHHFHRCFKNLFGINEIDSIYKHITQFILNLIDAIRAHVCRSSELHSVAILFAPEVEFKYVSYLYNFVYRRLIYI